MDEFEQYLPAIMRLAQAPRVEMCIRPSDVWFVLSALQLALRHPQFPKATAERVRLIADGMVALITEVEPALHDIAVAGFDPKQDMPVEQRDGD